MVWFRLCGLCRRTISRRFWSSWLLHLRFCARYVALCDSELSWSCQKRLENYSLVVSIASTVTRLDIDACIKTAQYLFGSHLLQQYQVVILWTRLLTVLPPLLWRTCQNGSAWLQLFGYVVHGWHTHTRLTALFPGLPGWASTRKVKPIWILLKQETLSGSGISWAVCKSAPRSRQITTPTPHHSVFYRPYALPAAQRTASKHWRQWMTLTINSSRSSWRISRSVNQTRATVNVNETASLAMTFMMAAVKGTACRGTLCCEIYTSPFIFGRNKSTSTVYSLIPEPDGVDLHMNSCPVSRCFCSCYC